MVRREVVAAGREVHWMDGRLPTNESIIRRTSIREMVKVGFDRATLIDNTFHRRSCRRKLHRYENFMYLLDLFLRKPLSSTRKQLDYAAYLLDPFAESSQRHYLVKELSNAEMYHKNKENFRALLLISNLDDALEVAQSIDSLASTIRFLVSPPESFDDYNRFQECLDDFLVKTTEYIDESSDLLTYLTDAGFRIERSSYRKL